MSSQPIPYPLRMPDELRDLLTERARASGRSLNAEIIGILQDAVSERQQALARLDVDALADAVADRVAAKLKGVAQE
jgi:plasmid stability protein